MKFSIFMFVACLVTPSAALLADVLENKFTYSIRLQGPYVSINQNDDIAAREQAILEFEKLYPESWAQEYEQKILQDIGSRTIVENVEVKRGIADISDLDRDGVPFAYVVKSEVQVTVHLPAGKRIYRTCTNNQFRYATQTNASDNLAFINGAEDSFTKLKALVNQWRNQEQTRHATSTSLVFLYGDDGSTARGPFFKGYSWYIPRQPSRGFKTPWRGFHEMVTKTGDFAPLQKAVAWQISHLQNVACVWATNK